jgi:sugar phosphate isomerase/epimerase
MAVIPLAGAPISFCYASLYFFQEILLVPTDGKTVGVEFLLTFGVNNAAQYDDYYKLMQDAAAYSQERGLKLVLKPHGGASGAAEEMMRCLEKVKHPNFKIWFAAGNILYYTGKDPLEELKPLAHQVTGFCAEGWWNVASWVTRRRS